MNNPRFAIRQLRKNPGFTTVAVVTLALGIGANTALFSVFKGLVLEPLPYPDPLRLVHVWKSERNTHGTMSLSALDYLELRARSGCFEELGLYTVWGWNLGGARTEAIQRDAMGSRRAYGAEAGNANLSRTGDRGASASGQDDPHPRRRGQHRADPARTE